MQDLYVPPPKGLMLLYQLKAADMAVTTDQAFTAVHRGIATGYRLGGGFCVYRSGAFNTACAGGVYSGAAKAGNVWIAASQSYANLTTGGKTVNLASGTNFLTDIITATPILSLTTGNGAALTADFFILGYPADLLP